MQINTTTANAKYINRACISLGETDLVLEGCVGTSSEMAGKAASCEEFCKSGKPRPPDPDLKKIAENLKDVKHKILVLSGKGGVGKSTCTANLSWALARDEDVQVGVMDADLCGPSIPKVMGAEGEEVHMSGDGWSPVFIEDNLSVMSVGLLLDPKAAIIWRGSKKDGMIKQFLKDVSWGDTDYLIIDTPPGTSDEHISLTRYLDAAGGIDGAVIVTTPQNVALLDVRKGISFCNKMGIKILGVVENMSGFVCPNCEKSSDIFPATGAGVQGMAKELGVKFLGKLPLDPRIAKACDQGKSFLDEIPDSPATAAYLNVVEQIVAACNSSSADAGEPLETTSGGTGAGVGAAADPGNATSIDAAVAAPLRFKVGDTVMANVSGSFSTGLVVKVWDSGKPYRIQLPDETEVWAPSDDDTFIRATTQPENVAAEPTSAI
eukprot:gene3185-15158_t